jgi:hypothetical protein
MKLPDGPRRCTDSEARDWGILAENGVFPGVEAYRGEAFAVTWHTHAGEKGPDGSTVLK